MYQFGFLRRGDGGFGGGGTTPPAPTVPHVLKSEIPADGDGVAVVFDQPMHMTAKLQDAMSIIVGGGSPVHPDHVEITPDGKMIGMMFPMHFFKPGDAVTWAYNDQHPTEELKGAIAGGLEIDNQTYAIENHAVTAPAASDWVDENGDTWVDGANNKWEA